MIDHDKLQKMLLTRNIRKKWIMGAVRNFLLLEGKKINFYRISYKQKIQAVRRNQVYFSSSNVSTDTTVIVKD